MVSAVALLQIMAAAPANAQPWVTRHQDAMWVGAFVDEPIDRKSVV